jgi:hypothetical protein
MRQVALAIVLGSIFLESGAGAAHAADRERQVVVELFTSQSCSACPPADAFLGVLAKRPGVIALGLHVDYWDYTGWKDPFAQRTHTERQRNYSRTLSQRYIYTPQMVIDGSYQNVGSDRDKVDKLIEKAHKATNQGPALAVVGDGLQRTLRIGRGATLQPATVWLVGFDRMHETAVAAGENSGRRLINYNVVRAMLPIGAWTGSAAELPLDLRLLPPSCDGAAVFVQADETGPIITAISLALPRR